MNPRALVRAIASLTSIHVTTDAGSFDAVYDENTRRIRLNTQLLGGSPVRDEHTMSVAGGFAIASTAAILSKASKLLHASNTHANVKVRIKADGQTSECEFPLPLRTTTIEQMRTFVRELQHAYAQTIERARERTTP